MAERLTGISAVDEYAMPQLQVHQAPDTIGVVALLFGDVRRDAVSASSWKSPLQLECLHLVRFVRQRMVSRTASP